MIVKNARKEDIDRALEIVNEKYEDNVIFNRFEEAGKRVIRFTVTLRVKNSRGKGAKLGPTGRHAVSACWHVHGDFLEALLKITPGAVIKSLDRTVTKDSEIWHDWNIGSLASPLMYSDACECWGR